MWHLTQLSFENYRTFERPETLDLAPLTVLIGRNSSGKSAIARLPLLLKRGLSEQAQAPLELEFDGHDFGASFVDLVNNRIPTRAITLGATVSDGKRSVEMEVAVGYWSEYRLQAIHSFKLKSPNLLLEIEWDRQGDPVKSGLRYSVNQEDWSDAEWNMRFRGIYPTPIPVEVLKLSTLGFLHPLEDAENALLEAFSKLIYLGPFRDAPQREDRLPEAIERDLGPRGGRTARVLADDWLRQGASVLRRVGAWYREHLGGWELDLERDGQRFSVVLRSPVDPTVAINLRDAGVGLSQVLPVVVQHELDRASGRSGGLNIVEQPELHLHPGAHGGLADLYIEAVTRGTSRFLIETHSENFILRIRRRIAEGKLAPADVAIYWVNDDLRATPRVKRINVDEKGGIDFWPAGVFEEDLREVQAIHRAQKDHST